MQHRSLESATYHIGKDHFVVVQPQVRTNDFLASFYYSQNPVCLGRAYVSCHKHAIDGLERIIEGKEVR